MYHVQSTKTEEMMRGLKGCIMLVMLLLISCKASRQSAVDCIPEREKHVNKMQKIPMDTTKPANRAKYD